MIDKGFYKIGQKILGFQAYRRNQNTQPLGWGEYTFCFF